MMLALVAKREHVRWLLVAATLCIVGGIALLVLS